MIWYYRRQKKTDFQLALVDHATTVHISYRTDANNFVGLGKKPRDVQKCVVYVRPGNNEQITAFSVLSLLFSPFLSICLSLSSIPSGPTLSLSHLVIIIGFTLLIKIYGYVCVHICWHYCVWCYMWYLCHARLANIKYKNLVICTRMEKSIFIQCKHH